MDYHFTYANETNKKWNALYSDYGKREPVDSTMFYCVNHSPLDK